ncbi:MAG: hypothetical protein JST39_06640, partial [Bacteroidetes bacterium]|nr:hypothetical protein [Bacteroidota bacterium]
AFMTDNFEARKNTQAATLTAAILGLLLLFLLLVSWTVGMPPPPSVLDEGIEVNLGSSDKGSGTDQPFEPGKPAPQEQQTYTPPKPVVVEKEEVKDVSTNDNDKEAPEIKKPVIAKPEATKIAEKETVKKPKKTMPVVTPTPPAPAPPRPKAVFHGTNGTGTGGNDADTYKKGSGEGIAGGKGDQGAPGGNPDSKNYTGGGRGNSGVSISRGLDGRHMTRLPSFEDEFNENAKVAVDIRVDASGAVTSAVFQQRGSTTSESNMKAIAIRKAMQIKFNAGGDESVGTIIFNFKLRN